MELINVSYVWRLSQNTGSDGTLVAEKLLKILKDRELLGHSCLNESTNIIVKGQNAGKIQTDMVLYSKDAKIFFGSVKACGEGISLVGASRVVILDQHTNLFYKSISQMAHL